MKRIPIKDLHKNVFSLPRLPIPSLAHTSERYRQSVIALRPSANDATAQQHLQKLDNFIATSGPVLQKQLLDREAEAAALLKANPDATGVPFSFIEPIVQERVLSSRAPLEVNMNAGFILKKHLPGLQSGLVTTAAADAAVKNANQAFVAGSLAYGIARWIDDARKNGVEVKKDSVDMSPLLLEFGRSLVPTVSRDEVVLTPVEKLRHVIVLHDGHPFLVQLFDDAGALLPREVIIRSMQLVLNVTPDHDNTSPVSVLTAGSRAVWGQAYQELLKSSAENAAALQAFQESVIVICLDNAEWGQQVIDAAGATLHSDSIAGASAMHGAREELENRWYDKHQLIVSGDGQAAFNFEQTGSERVHWGRWIDDVLATLAAEEAQRSGPAVAAAAAAVDGASLTAYCRPLHITYGKSLVSHIRTARAEALEVVAETEMRCFSIPYGRRALAGLGTPVSSFMQLCLLVAHYQMRERLAAMSEQCSTARFFHGGTELVRCATPETLQVAIRIEQLRRAKRGGEGNPMGDEPTLPRYRDLPRLLGTEERDGLLTLVRAACLQHQLLVGEAANGMGIDSHLLALQCAAANNKDKAGLAFFEDPLYEVTGRYVLSTNEFSRPWLSQNVCGPSGSDGYGIGYVCDEDEIRVSLTDFVNSPSSDAAEFERAVMITAETLYTLMSPK